VIRISDSSKMISFCSSRREEAPARISENQYLEPLHEPYGCRSASERCCGWSPTQPRSVVHGSNAHFSNVEALHEPSNIHAAPTELGKRRVCVGGYRHGAPTELLRMVHGKNECARRSSPPTKRGQIGRGQPHSKTLRRERCAIRRDSPAAAGECGYPLPHSLHPRAHAAPFMASCHSILEFSLRRLVRRVQKAAIGISQIPNSQYANPQDLCLKRLS